MNGIRIYGQPDFAELFQPIFNELQGLSWITLTEAFQFPADWVDASDFDETTGRYTTGPCADFARDVRHIIDEARGIEYGYASDANIFPQYARAVHEDWTTIFGFRQPIANAREWLERYYAARPRSAVAAGAEVCFRNVDNSFWEFYVREQRIMDLLRPHLATLDVRVDECRLDESPGL